MTNLETNGHAMNLDQFNQLSVNEAEKILTQCCTSDAWVGKMNNIRPFENRQQLSHAANEAWLGLKESDYLQAFDGHPKIGDVNSLRKKYANTKEIASGEQQSVNEASEKTLLDLAKYNDEYLNKFGFIFIVCATGKSASEMLSILSTRLSNDRETELSNAAEEQRKIFQIRLTKLFGDS